MAIFPNDESITVVPRANRPSEMSLTFLELFFLQNGNYVHPNRIRSVYIFKATADGASDKFIDSDPDSVTFGQVLPSKYSSAAYIVSGSALVGPSDASFSADLYSGTPADARKVYTIAPGHYGIVADKDATFLYGGDTVSSTVIGTGQFFDIWEIMDVSGSTYTSYVHSFELYSDNIVTVTEAIHVETRNKLVQRYINFGSKTNLEITTDISVTSKYTADEIRNAFNGSVIQAAEIQIVKLADTGSEPPTVTVAWTSTNVGSNDTISYLFDTSALSRGTFEIQVRYDILSETIYSEKFRAVVR